MARSQDPPNHAIPIRMMTFNILYGGVELDLTSRSWSPRPGGSPKRLGQVIEAVASARPDIVGLQEAVMNTRPIADRLGWHACERTQIISRFPLTDPPGGNGRYVFIEPRPGRIVAVANVHLPAENYGPYALRDGATFDEVVELETRHRVRALRPHLEVLPPLASKGVPVLLTGDFNTPSHLDWTAAVSAVRRDVPDAVEWPVSKFLADAGFRDSYREAHPDPVRWPGFTWTPGSPEGERPESREIHDRIDWILAAGPIQVTASEIVGEPGYPDVAIAVDPWPSDHRAVVSTFDVTLGEMPILVAVDRRRLVVGDPLAVRVHAPGQDRGAVAIVPAGGNTASTVASQGTGGPADEVLSFATKELRPGAHEAILIAADGRELARIPFWLYEPNTPARVTTSKEEYRVGEPIIVSWTNAPGMKWDWVGLYASRATPTGETRESEYPRKDERCMLYEYTGAAVEGTTAFRESSRVRHGTWPLPPGPYEVRLLLDDGYRSIASSAPFRVVER